MKPMMICAFAAALSLAAAGASARTEKAPQNDNDRVTNTLAGPPPTPNKAEVADAPEAKGATAQPSKKALKKSKVKQKPPLNDPN